MPRKSLVAVAVLVTLVLVPTIALGFRSGPLAGHTGAPSINSGRTCTFCHTGQNTGSATFRITVPSQAYAPGSPIPVTVSFTGTLLSTKVNGYQMAGVVSSAKSALAGWTLTSSNSQIVSNHVEHTRNGAANRSSWTSYFTTPTSATTGFTFHAAGNDADANGLNTGDHIYTTSVVMTPGNVPLSLRSLPSVGSVTTLDLSVPTDAGKPYVLAASFSNAGIQVGGKKVPLFPDALFGITLGNVLPTIFQKYQGVLDNTGKAAARLAAPNISALKGITLHHAFVVIDAKQARGIGTVSNPLPVLLL